MWGMGEKSYIYAVLLLVYYSGEGKYMLKWPRNGKEGKQVWERMLVSNPYSYNKTW